MPYKQFGIDILKRYGEIDIAKVKEYADIHQKYYPIETICYGLNTKRDDFVRMGREILNERSEILQNK